MTLSDFLLARIAEDEATARDATPVGEARTFYTSFGAGSDDWGCWYFNVDPARVLAECEAKRQIVLAYEHGLTTGHVDASAPIFGKWVVQQLALPFADHPDYRRAWKP